MTESSILEEDDENSEVVGSAFVTVGYGSGGEEGPALSKFLVNRRHRVDDFVASDEAADDQILRWVESSDSQPRMIFLVVTQADVEAGDRQWVKTGVIEQARKLQAAFGQGRVLLVVETNITEFNYKTGIEDILFTPGDLAAKNGEIAATVIREFPSDVISARKKKTESVPLLGGDRSSSGFELDSKIALLAVGVFAVFGAIYIIASFFGNEDNSVLSEPTVAGTQSSPQTTLPRSVQPPPGPPANQAPLSPGPSTRPPFASPRNTVAFPVTCRVSLRKTDVLPEILTCADNGGLRIKGVVGPWHNSISRVGLEPGITGSLNYEKNGEVVALREGVTVLDKQKAAFGVQEVTFRFTANGQKAQFEQFTDQGKKVVTFTFDSALGQSK